MSGIVDSHMHIWRQTDLPWLLGPVTEHGFGDYTALQRDYLIAEYRRDLEPLGIDKAIHIQSGRAPNWAVDEVAWVQSIADQTGWPHGIVAFANLKSADLRPTLDRLSRYPLLRGVQLRCTAASIVGSAVDEILLRNIGHLADYGLSLDLDVGPQHLGEVVEIVKAAPAVTFILDHAGRPDGASEASWGRWGGHIKALAAYPNVVAKLSGLGMIARGNDPALATKAATELIKRFGPKRCMFGSNFPFETLWTNAADLVATYEAATGSLGAAARRAVFGATATRIYRL